MFAPVEHSLRVLRRMNCEKYTVKIEFNKKQQYIGHYNRNFKCMHLNDISIRLSLRYTLTHSRIRREQLWCLSLILSTICRFEQYRSTIPMNREKKNGFIFWSSNPVTSCFRPCSGKLLWFLRKSFVVQFD